MEKKSKDYGSDNNNNSEDVEESEYSDELRLQEALQLQFLEKREQLFQQLESDKQTLGHIQQMILGEEAFPLLLSNIERPVSPISVPFSIERPISPISVPFSIERPISPIRSPIYDPQNTLPYTPEVIYDLVKEMDEEPEIVICDDSPPDTADNNYEDFIDLKESPTGKGKEAKNPNFRYVKRSKPEVSVTEVSSQDTAVAPSKNVPGTPETSILKMQSPKSDTRISPSVKRKESDLNESCASTSIDSKLSENLAEDNKDLNLTKKLKSEDYEELRNQYPTVTSLLSQKSTERVESSKCADQSQTDHSYSEQEHLAVPSTSKIKETSCETSREESSMLSGKDDRSCSERKESSLASGKSEKPDPALVNDPRMTEVENQSQTDQSCNEPYHLAIPSTSGIKFLSCATSSEESSMFTSDDDRSRSEREESSLTSGCEEVSQSDKKNPILMRFMNNPPIVDEEILGIYTLGDLVDVIAKERNNEKSHSNSEES